MNYCFYCNGEGKSFTETQFLNNKNLELLLKHSNIEHFTYTGKHLPSRAYHKHFVVYRAEYNYGFVLRYAVWQYNHYVITPDGHSWQEVPVLIPTTVAAALPRQINLSLSPEAAVLAPLIQQSIDGLPIVSIHVHATLAESVKSLIFVSAAANATKRFPMSATLVFTENISNVKKVETCYIINYNLHV